MIDPHSGGCVGVAQVLAVGADWFDFSNHHRPPPVHEKGGVFVRRNPELSLHSGVPARRCVSAVSKYGFLVEIAVFLPVPPITVCLIILPIFKDPLTLCG